MYDIAIVVAGGWAAPPSARGRIALVSELALLW